MNHTGTCNDESCELFGFCHDGCGLPTRDAPQHRFSGRYATRTETKGRPRMYRHGHAPTSRVNLEGREVRVLGGEARREQHVPVERVVPLVRWLKERHGNLIMVGVLTGVKRRCLSKILHGRQRSVKTRTAERIVAAVLSMQPADSKHTPRPPLAIERDSSRKEGSREARAAFRAGKKPEKYVYSEKRYDSCSCGQRKRTKSKRCLNCELQRRAS